MLQTKMAERVLMIINKKSTTISSLLTDYMFIYLNLEMQIC